MVAENKTGSCGIIEIFSRNESSEITPVSIPSIKIFPSILANLNNAPIRELFPAPVTVYKKGSFKSL